MMSHSPIQTRSSSHGQTLVEFAMVLPLLVLILMGIFDLGRAIYYYNVLNNTVHEVARKAITCGGEVQIDCSNVDEAAKTSAVNTTVGVPITTANLKITPDVRAYDSTITVTGSVLYVPITPLIARVIGSSDGFTMTARSQMQANGTSLQ